MPNRRSKLLFVALLLFALVWNMQAQRRVGIAYYELGPLYDTIPSLFANDEAYTPQGRLAWSGVRYREAVARYAKLLDSMAMPVVGIFGVESEQTALDLAARSGMYYTVLHRTSNRLDGLDFALLYQADRLFPKRVEEGYGWLSVEVELEGCEVVLLLVRDDRFLAARIEELQAEDPARSLIVMGRCREVSARFGLQDGVATAEARGRGSCRRKGGWLMRHGIAFDDSWRLVRGDVFARRWLLDSTSGEPLPIYRKERYLGGYGENLPVFVYLEPQDLEN